MRLAWISLALSIIALAVSCSVLSTALHTAYPIKRTTTVVVHETTTIIESLTATTPRNSVTVVNSSLYLLPLPQIRRDSMPLEVALSIRRSIREYLNEPITVFQLSQLLWAADGVNDPWTGFRTAPSAGALYPLTIYVVIGERSVIDSSGHYLPAGVYRYDPYIHALILVKRGDVREELYRAALNQPWVLKAPIDIVICANFSRTTSYYGSRGYRYVYMEVGHVGQNIYLEAAALGLATVAVGAFYDDEVRKIIGAPQQHHPLYIMPVGVPAKPYRVSEEQIWSFIEEHRHRAIGRP